MKLVIYIFIITTLFFTGCTMKEEVVVPKEEKIVPPPVKPTTENMKAVSFTEIEGFYKDDLNHALEVFKKDCKKSV